MPSVRVVLVVLALSALFAGCASKHSFDGFLASNAIAVDTLMISPQIEIEKDAPLLVGTVVNVDSMNQSSRFGRTVSELVASRLTQLGYNVIEMKLRSSGVYIREGTGELLLSRDIRDLSSNYNAKIVIVGNYSVASQYVYMTLKAVSVADNRVISAVNYSLPITVDNRALLFPPKQ